MEHKPWLSYVNLITFIILIFVCIALAIAFAYGDIGLGLLIGMFPTAFIAIAAVVVIGFLGVLLLNFSTVQRDKSGWIIFVAFFLFIPAALCLIGLAIFALPMFGK
jgi:hypothetical protein